MKHAYNENLKLALHQVGIKSYTPIQQEAIPILLKKQNLIMKAPTGTGKTYAFLIPILSTIDVELLQTQALILTPTRELAIQINKVLQEIISHMDVSISTATLVGGKDRQQLMKSLEKTQPQIIIGTPGRCEDLMVKEHLVNVSTIKTVVLDEADMIVENGFLESIDAIFSLLPQKDVLYAICSATIPQEIEHFIKKYIKNIKTVEAIHNKNAPQVEHLFLDVTGKDKPMQLLKVMDTFSPYLCLIFANTKKQVIELHTFLTEQGLKVGILHGDMKSRERNQMLKRIHNLDFQYVVASDMAARGIDIDGVSHVINYEIPTLDIIQFYFHRTGRTGRMNYDGTIVSFYTKDQLHILQKLAQQKVNIQTIKLRNNEIIRLAELKTNSTAFVVDDEILKVSKHAKRLAHKKGKVKPGYKKKIKVKVTEAIRREKIKQSKRKRK